MVNIATIGTGFIVDSFLEAVKKVEGFECIAMYSRNKESALELATKYEIQAIFTDLEEMLLDDRIEIIYIASPNSLHFEHAQLAMEHGKHVICEKPLTSTVSELEKLIELSTSKGLFFFEAITTIHLPNFQLIKKHLAEIGKVKLIQCNYSQYSSRYDKLLAGEEPNVFNPQFSGGALQDINIYNLHFTIQLFGKPTSINYEANKHSNGIDTSGIATLTYPDFIATCVGAKDTDGMNFVLIQGEKGYIHVENGANGCEKIHLTTKEKTVTLNAQVESNRLYYETKAFYEIINEKDSERAKELLHHSLQVSETAVEARKYAGIVFAADGF